MSSPAIAIGPLALDALTRDYYGHYDAWVKAQLDPLADLTCYQPKFYKAPASQDELIPANGNATYGLKITPGSLLYGFYLPGLVSTLAPLQFAVQILDTAFRHEFWDTPVPSLFLANFKPTGISTNPLLADGAIFSFPSLLPAPYPIIQDAILDVQIWNQTGTQTRIELIFGVLENVEC